MSVSSRVGELRGDDELRGGVEAGERRQGLLGSGPGLLETSQLRQHAGIQRPGALVVGVHRRVELAAELRVGLEERRDPLVQLPARGGDLPGRLRDLLLAPPVVGRVQQRDQRRRRRDQHALGRAVLEQRRLGLQRGAVDALVRDEHHHELRRGLRTARGRPSTPARRCAGASAGRAAAAAPAARPRRSSRARADRRPSAPSHPPRRRARRAGARRDRGAAGSRRSRSR